MREMAAESQPLHNDNLPTSLELEQSLEATANRWTPWSIATTDRLDKNSPAIMDRKVKGLLNKLTQDRFDSISDQLIACANLSEQETDGRTLKGITRHLFESATREAVYSEIHARLCLKVLVKISPNVVDESIVTTEGQPFSGGQLFRKYLINRCQEEFERDWQIKETAAAMASDGERRTSKEEPAESALDYSAQKARRQSLGLTKFIAELFKLQMLTERIMHQCIKKLLINIVNPPEEEIECLCVVMITVGQLLDTRRARKHMDLYFTKMRVLASSPEIAMRMHCMLVDVIELRQRGWQARNNAAASTTIPAIHEQAAKERIVSSSGRVRGEQARIEDSEHVNASGWNTGDGPAPPLERPLAKVGDLAKFGQIGKSTSTTYGPSSVFKKKIDLKREFYNPSSTSNPEGEGASTGRRALDELPRTT